MNDQITNHRETKTASVHAAQEGARYQQEGESMMMGGREAAKANLKRAPLNLSDMAASA